MDMEGRLVKGSGRVRIPIWLSRDYKPNAGGWANLISIFNATPNTAQGYSILSNIDIASDLRPFIKMFPPFNGDSNSRSEKTIALTPETWHIIELHFDSSGKVTLSVDGSNSVSAQLDPNSIVGIAALHSGAYGIGLPVNAYVLNGPIEIDVW